MENKERLKNINENYKNGNGFLYSVEGYYGDIDAFKITMLSEINLENGNFLGIEKGCPGAREHEFNANGLYTFEEAERIFHIKLKNN